MTAENRIYLDYAATTPIHPQVLDVVRETYQVLYGNPSSLHQAGRLASQAVKHARNTLAEGIGAARPDEIIFTGSGSEADSLALLGVAEAYKDQGNHIITSSIEHHAILHACEHLEGSGFEISYLPVDSDGLVQPEELKKNLQPDTILVSIMHANNEIGTIQAIQELVEITHDQNVLFHTDAVQSIGQIPVDVSVMGVDLLTLSAHKFYGPKGVGILYVKDGVNITPLIHGGMQENGRRAGTENVPGIVGTAKALEIALEELPSEAERLGELRDHLWNRLTQAVHDIRLNGHPTDRLPNNLNISFKNVEAEGLLLLLNARGVEASMGSACTSESIEPSHVIRALNVPSEYERGTLRLSLGKHTTKADISTTADLLIEIVQEL